jgi:hypothetical protein
MGKQTTDNLGHVTFSGLSSAGPFGLKIIPPNGYEIAYDSEVAA